MIPQPEREACKGIDKLLTVAGWVVCDMVRAGVAGQEMTLRLSIMTRSNTSCDLYIAKGKT